MREAWADYRALITTQMGDTSFHSFVKWLISNINQVNQFSIDFLAPQSGALRISAYRDFLPSHPTTYSFEAFKPFYGDLKQPKQTDIRGATSISDAFILNNAH